MFLHGILIKEIPKKLYFTLWGGSIGILFQINYGNMVKEWKDAPGDKFPRVLVKQIKPPGNSRKILTAGEKLQMLQDMNEFSKESFRRNQIYLYVSLFLLFFSVITLIVITSSFLYIK